ncbi:MAG: CDP-alcohol phosphatidyltransferase family protein [Opitutaceae bacterium]|jgi:CDP-diacylglycerol--serine O-phosphatidyltransferase|nr:CDP-alcohol phosphatidyltransferase family protein [Opitutaceae bacterium]
MSKPDPREDPYNVTQASRIYILPNLMTACNLLCGFVSLICCIQALLAESSPDGLYQGNTMFYFYRLAVYFILGAAFFDSLDGRLARMGGRESLFGAEFDSLADVVSFGIAPAMMMSFFILSPLQTPGLEWSLNIGWGIGFIYLLCAAMRLARFNVITNPLLHRGARESGKDFLGLPVPAAAATVAATVLFLIGMAEGERHLNHLALVLPPLMLLIALLMMSTVRFPSGKNIGMQTRARFGTLALLLALAAVIFFYKEIGFLCICIGYLFFGLCRHWRRRPAPRAGEAARAPAGDAADNPANNPPNNPE